MIDIHSHLLPMLDDGAADIREMNKILELYNKEGINVVIATPHFKSGVYDNHYEKVVSIINRLGITSFVAPGQEIYLDADTLKACNDGRIKGINGSSYLLIELSFEIYKAEYISYIIELKNLGYKLIIAHPERYLYFIENPDLLDDYIDMGCLFQINAHSLEGLFGSKIKKFAINIIESGLADFLATDCHSATNRAPRLKRALDIIDKVRPELKEILISNAHSLVDGRELISQQRSKIKQKRSLILRIKKIFR